MVNRSHVTHTHTCAFSSIPPWITSRLTGVDLYVYLFLIPRSGILPKNLQRNDAFDAYGTFPIHQRPNNVKDTFAEGVQHTQFVKRTSCTSLAQYLCPQATDCYGNQRPRNQIQGWHHDGCRQPRCVIRTFHSSSFLIRPPASYGSLARFRDVQRLHAVGNHTVLGASGDMSDFQYIRSLLDDLVIEEFTEQDEHTLGPAEIHEYLSQLMYARRSKLNPLWNSLLVGGYKDGKR